MQLMDQGIIQSFKMKYRAGIIKEKIEAIEYGSTMPTIDIKDSIYKIKASWDSVSQTIIKNCLKKAEFIKNNLITDVHRYKQ